MRGIQSAIHPPFPEGQAEHFSSVPPSSSSPETQPATYAVSDQSSQTLYPARYYVLLLFSFVLFFQVSIYYTIIIDYKYVSFFFVLAVLPLVYKHIYYRFITLYDFFVVLYKITELLTERFMHKYFDFSHNSFVFRFFSIIIIYNVFRANYASH